MKNDEQQEAKGKPKETNCVAFYLGISGALVGFLLLRHVMKSKGKQSETTPENHNPAQSLQPESDKDASSLPVATRNEDGLNQKWYHSADQREIAIARAAKITLWFFIPYVIVTAGLFVIGGCQLLEIHKQLTLDQRAWVGVDGMLNEFAVGPSGERVKVSFTLKFKNYGKTPALNVAPVFGEFNDVNQIPPSGSFFPETISHSLQLFPNVEAQFPIDALNPRQYSNTFAAIKSGKPYYIAGTIWYDDIFGNHYWTEFCNKVDANFNFEGVAIHNACGKGYPKKSK